MQEHCTQSSREKCDIGNEARVSGLCFTCGSHNQTHCELGDQCNHGTEARDDGFCYTCGGSDQEVCIVDGFSNCAGGLAVSHTALDFSLTESSSVRVTNVNSDFYNEVCSLIRHAVHYESMHLVDNFERLSVTSLTKEFYEVVIGEGVDPRGNGIYMTLHGAPHKFKATDLTLIPDTITYAGRSQFARGIAPWLMGAGNVKATLQDCKDQCESLLKCRYGTYKPVNKECWLAEHTSSHPVNCFGGATCQSFDMIVECGVDVDGTSLFVPTFAPTPGPDNSTWGPTMAPTSAPSPNPTTAPTAAPTYLSVFGTSDSTHDKAGTACQFPLTFQGKQYSSCINADYHTYWCVTDTGAYATDAATGWGECKIGAEDTSDSIITDKGLLCQFPFEWSGESFSSCTSKGKGKFWCVTNPEVYAASNDKSEGWGYCSNDYNIPPLIHYTTQMTGRCADENPGKLACEMMAIADELRDSVVEVAPNASLPAGCFVENGQPFYNTPDHVANPTTDINRAYYNVSIEGGVDCGTDGRICLCTHSSYVHPNATGTNVLVPTFFPTSYPTQPVGAVYANP